MLLAKIIYQDLLPVETSVTFDIPYKTEYCLWHTIAKNASIYKSHLAHFHSRARKKIKKSTQKKCSYFEKWNFLALMLKEFLYFLEGKLSLYFRKRNLLVFPKMETCNSQPNPKKTKKLHRKKIPCISQNGTL